MSCLVTFGCSFSNYSWPTWAEILAHTGHWSSFENWAVGGMGNRGIAQRVMYRRFSKWHRPDDVYVIQWTTPAREDRVLDGRWRAEGSVFVSPTYGEDWAAKYWSWPNDLVNTAHARLSTRAILGTQLAYEFTRRWQWATQDPVEATPRASQDLDLAHEQHWLGVLPAIDTRGPERESAWSGLVRDSHPDSPQWLEWCEKRILPALGLTMPRLTRSAVTTYAHRLHQQLTTQTGRNRGLHPDQVNPIAARLTQNTWTTRYCWPGQEGRLL